MDKLAGNRLVGAGLGEVISVEQLNATVASLNQRDIDAGKDHAGSVAGYIHTGPRWPVAVAGLEVVSRDEPWGNRYVRPLFQTGFTSLKTEQSKIGAPATDPLLTVSFSLPQAGIIAPIMGLGLEDLNAIYVNPAWDWAWSWEQTGDAEGKIHFYLYRFQGTDPSASPMTEALKSIWFAVRVI